MATNDEFYAVVASRLVDLVVMAVKDAEQAPISDESLKDFNHFCAAIETSWDPPSITLTHEGNIVAEWRKGEDDLFCLEFLGGRKVEYIIFKPATKPIDWWPDGVLRVRGSGLLGAYRILDKDVSCFVSGWSDPH